MKVISVEHLSKSYRLGLVSTGSTRRIGSGMFRHAQPGAFADDPRLWWAKMRDMLPILIRKIRTIRGKQNYLICGKQYLFLNHD